MVPKQIRPIPNVNIPFHNNFSLQDWHTAWPTGDHDRFIAFASDHDVWKNLSDHFPHPYTMADAEAWVAQQSGVDPAKHFAICDPQGPIGRIGLTFRQRGPRPTPQKSATGWASPSGAVAS